MPRPLTPCVPELPLKLEPGVELALDARRRCWRRSSTATDAEASDFSRLLSSPELLSWLSAAPPLPAALENAGLFSALTRSPMIFAVSAVVTTW